MRVLFLMSHPGHVRNFESLVRELADRGHDVQLAFDREKEELPRARAGAEALADDEPHISIERVPAPERNEEWTLVGRQFRAMLDYLRYLDPPFENSTRLRERAAARMPPGYAAVANLASARRVLKPVLGFLEASVPPRESIRAYVTEREPDLLVVTPLVDLGSSQVESVRAAKELGVPAVLCVSSWDNLTNKGLLHEIPDRVVVWNDRQQREAVDLHGVPADRLVVGGASAYDQWFEREPSRTRAELTEVVGLPAERPLLLYVGSSRFVAPDEGDWALRWADAVRGASSETVRRAAILIRPHPLNPFTEAQRARLAALGDVVVWPPAGDDPIDEPARADYFDSLFHADAVIGLNTSAMVEAAIVGTPVLTVVTPEFREGQAGTIHFSYLLSENGGPAVSAPSLAEHVRELDRALDGEFAQRSEFVRTFIRPNGLEQPVSPQLAEALEGAARPSVRRSGSSLGARAVRPLLVAAGWIGLLVRGRLRKSPSDQGELVGSNEPRRERVGVR